LRGINAAVVGILPAALYDPPWKSAVGNWRDAVLAVIGYLLLIIWKTPSWLVVAGLAVASLGLVWPR